MTDKQWEVAVSVPGYDVDLNFSPACEKSELYIVYAIDDVQACDYAIRQQKILMVPLLHTVR